MRVKVKSSRFSRKLAQAMRHAGLSQAELARKTGLSTGHIADLVNGVKGHRPALETVVRLSMALGKDVTFFA